MGTRPSALSHSFEMSDSELMANKENSGWEADVEEQKPVQFKDNVKDEPMDCSAELKKKPTVEKFVRMKLRAKRITEVSLFQS